MGRVVMALTNTAKALSAQAPRLGRADVHAEAFPLRVTVRLCSEVHPTAARPIIHIEGHLLAGAESARQEVRTPAGVAMIRRINLDDGAATVVDDDDCPVLAVIACGVRDAGDEAGTQ